MTFIISVPATGKELKISHRVAKEVFGIDDGIKKFVCLPCAGDIKTQDLGGAPQIHVQKIGRKRKLHGTCVIRMGGIGDLIMLSSGLRELKQRMGETKLTFATLPQHIEFVKSFGVVDRCIPVESLGRYNFDQVIDLRFKVEPPQLGTICTGTWDDYTNKDRSDVFDELLGVYPCPKRFGIKVDGKATRKMAKLVDSNQAQPTILINCSMVSPARSIISRYIEPICKKITETIGRVILCGASSPWNKTLNDISGDGITNLIDKTSLAEFISLVSLASLVVTPDTGTLHIAGAMGKRTLALFGNINPRTRISYYPNVRPLYPHGELSCVPCGDLHPCLEKPEIGSKCMALLTPEVICNAIAEEIQGVRNTPVKHFTGETN